MALDDASDPFQQVVYLQEGEDQDFLIAYCKYESTYFFGPYMRSLYVINPETEVVVKRIEIPSNILRTNGTSNFDGNPDYLNGNFDKLISAPGGIIYIILAYEYFRFKYWGYGAIKINTVTEQIEAQSDIFFNNQFRQDNEPVACFADDHLYIGDVFTISKLKSSDLSTVNYISTPRSPLPSRYESGEIFKYNGTMKTDGQKIFFTTTEIAGYYRPSDDAFVDGITRGAIYELDKDTLGTALVDHVDCISSSLPQRDILAGLAVENGVVYWATRDSDNDGLFAYPGGKKSSFYFENPFDDYAINTRDGLVSGGNRILYPLKINEYTAFDIGGFSQSTISDSTAPALLRAESDFKIMGDKLVIFTNKTTSQDRQLYIIVWDIYNDSLIYSKPLAFPNDPLVGFDSVYKTETRIAAIQS